MARRAPAHFPGERAYARGARWLRRRTFRPRPRGSAPRATSIAGQTRGGAQSFSRACAGWRHAWTQASWSSTVSPECVQPEPRRRRRGANSRPSNRRAVSHEGTGRDGGLRRRRGVARSRAPPGAVGAGARSTKAHCRADNALPDATLARVRGYRCVPGVFDAAHKRRRGAQGRSARSSDDSRNVEAAVEPRLESRAGRAPRSGATSRAAVATAASPSLISSTQTSAKACNERRWRSPGPSSGSASTGVAGTR